jgi:metal-sulfur cluster biosynthetic enzyme
MGLVLGWALADDGTLSVLFCVTFPGCTMAPHFTEAARFELRRLPGVRSVHIRIDPAFAWTPDRMQPAPPMQGKPQAWRDRAAAGR